VSVLVILEQQGGEWHRMSWETLAAAQEFAATLGEPVEAAVAGKGIGTLAAEAASKKVAKVWAVEHDLLDAYTADGYAWALEELVRQAAPSLVVFPHSYQTRDFAPKLATRFSQVLISDVIAAMCAQAAKGRASYRCRRARGGRIRWRAAPALRLRLKISRPDSTHRKFARRRRLHFAKRRARWI
jgi:electron transfer flavoprotein alpha subunit